MVIHSYCMDPVYVKKPNESSDANSGSMSVEECLELQWNLQIKDTLGT